MSVTIKEIAKHTGLSIPTVGNVLGRGAARYSAETRRRVQEAAKELGYRPNSSARSMRQGRIGCAALVLSRAHAEVLSHIPAGLVDGLDDELAAHNMHLAVSRLSDEQLSTADIVPKVLREYMADGMIVNYTHVIPGPLLELIHAHHTPAVFLNAKLDVDCVYPDDRGGAEMATRALLERGHRRIAFLHMAEPLSLYASEKFEDVWPMLHYSVAERTAGYRATMEAAGLVARVVYADRLVRQPDSVGVCRELLTGGQRPTAIISYSEHQTASAMVAAAGLGLSVPGDVVLVEFCPQRRSLAGVEIPNIAVPTREMGRRAVQMLMKKLGNGGQNCEPVRVPYEAMGAGLPGPGQE